MDRLFPLFDSTTSADLKGPYGLKLSLPDYSIYTEVNILFSSRFICDVGLEIEAPLAYESVNSSVIFWSLSCWASRLYSSCSFSYMIFICIGFEDGFSLLRAFWFFLDWSRSNFKFNGGTINLVNFLISASFIIVPLNWMSKPSLYIFLLA